MLNLPNNYKTVGLTPQTKYLSKSQEQGFNLINKSLGAQIGSKSENLLFRQSDFINQMRTNLEFLLREKVRDSVDSSLGSSSWVVGGETARPWMEDVLVNVGTGLEAVRVVVVRLVGVVGGSVPVAGSAVNRWRHSDVEAWLEEDHLLLIRGEVTT